jgi:hypothetical protein
MVRGFLLSSLLARQPEKSQEARREMCARCELKADRPTEGIRNGAKSRSLQES